MIFPDKIKLIIWDLDETLWQGTLSDNCAINLNHMFVDFINDSLDKGIVHSICSKNDFDITKEFMVSENLWDLFVFPSIDWNSKGERIKNIIDDMKLRPQNTLFVDDNTLNLNEALYFCPELQTCTPHELAEVMEEICSFGKKDETRSRLQKYRILEEKNKLKKEYTSNDDFLMSCNISVEIHNDCTECIENIDRIHDLIMRSNQLNYTKFRQNQQELIEDLSSPNTQAGYVTVNDSFGDYGIVGFYMIVDGKVKHYLFSCRTLGMLVEQYVYVKIGCPQINVAGEVITELDNHTIPGWINKETTLNDSAKTKHDTGNLKILFKGPCDMSQIFSFIEETDSITTEFTYMTDTGMSVEGHNQTSQLVTSLKAGAEKLELINDTPWLDDKMLDASSWHENDVIVFSLLSDGNLGIYQHKKTKWHISLCEGYYDLTDSNNWDDYINKKIFTSGITFTKEILEDFSSKYQYVNNDEGDVTVKNLEILYNEKRNNSKLILLLGSEKEYQGQSKPSYENRHIFHQVLNQKVRNWASGKKDVFLIELGEYVTSQKDYLDTINHLQKKVYYRIAQDIISVLESDSSSIKVKSKMFLYWNIFVKKAKTLAKKIIR